MREVVYRGPDFFRGAPPEAARKERLSWHGRDIAQKHELEPPLGRVGKLKVFAGKREVECLDEGLGYPLDVPSEYFFQACHRSAHARASTRVQPRRFFRRGA